MLKFAMRHGLVRLIGGRAVPLMWAWDVAVLANKARRIPVVDRTLRRGAGSRGSGRRHGRGQPAVGDASRPPRRPGAPAGSAVRATSTWTRERASRRTARSRTPC